MNLEKIFTLEYKGYATEFHITPKVKEFLLKNKVDYKEFLPNEFQFYETELFEMLDPYNKGYPEEKFGKSFKVIYFGVIEKWMDKKPIGFSDELDFHDTDDPGRLMIKKTKEHEQFELKYTIIKNL